MSDRDDNVKPMDGRQRPDPARVKEFADTARRLQRERTGAGDVVSKVLDSTPREEWPSLAERTELRNSGALDQLAARLRAVCEKNPKEALAVSALATAIAETLPPDAYPGVTLAQLRAQAWKDRAHTLRYLARYDEAFQAIEMAERALAPYPAAAYDRAVVALVKAATLQHVERFEESRVLLMECRRVFGEHGDTTRYLYCGITEVALLYREGKYQEARDAGNRLLRSTIDAGDVESAARLHHNVGCCDVQLGNLAEGNRHLATAKSIFVDLGKTNEAARGERVFGSLLVTKGHVDSGITVLQAARAALLDSTLVEEAGACGLTIAAAMLQKRNMAGAHTMVRTVIDEFSAAGLNRRAVEAMNYLSQEIDAGTALPETAIHVEQYVAALHLDPSRQFMPLHA